VGNDSVFHLIHYSYSVFNAHRASTVVWDLICLGIHIIGFICAWFTWPLYVIRLLEIMFKNKECIELQDETNRHVFTEVRIRGNLAKSNITVSGRYLLFDWYRGVICDVRRVLLEGIAYLK
jgi:hypothetical protein